MLIKPNWDNFKAKFSENPQDNFEWFCYLLFSKEYNQPYGTHRYKNQSGIETDPIQVGDEVIGWQSKFYEDSLSNHKEDLLGTLTKTKRDNPNITKIILYTNSEWGQGQGTKEPKAKTETEEKAKELKIDLVWRVKSYFESPFVCQEQKDISRYFFELDSKWELSSLGFIDTLKNNYLNKFSTISLLINDTPKPIEDIFINLAIIKEKKETKQDKNLMSREALLNRYEEIHKSKEPIEIEELINISNKSLIYGKAGIGKTTFCKFIAYKWAKGELYSEFEYVVYLPLREWKTGGILQAIKNYYFPLDSEDLIFKLKGANRLFLFDGYDELSGERKKDLRDEIEKYGLSHYIITTRPYGYQRNDFRVDEHFETIGFVDEDVEKYIDNFFEESEPKKRLKAFLNSNIGIKHIAYIPLMLEMICSLWQEQPFSDSLTMTELYSAVVESILKKHSAKKEDEAVYKRANRKKINNILGKLAFRGLTKQTILFDGNFIEEVIDEEDIEFFEKSVINSGFLKSDRQEKDMLDNNFEFLHLTFQEYFSALYVASLSKDEQSKIIRNWKFYPHMQVFFAFLGGLIEDKEFLLGEIESEPRDLFGYYQFYILSFCSSQMNVSELKENRINDINLQVLKWIKKPSENFFDILKNIVNFINEEIMIKELLPYLQNESTSNKIRENIAKLFMLLNKNDDKYVDILLHILQHTHPSNMEFISSSLLCIPRDNDSIVDSLILIIKKNKINSYRIRDIFHSLLKLNRNDDKLFNLLIDFIKNENSYTTYYLNTLKRMKRNDKYFIDNIIGLIECEKISIYTRTEIAELFTILEIDNIKRVNYLIDFIQNENIQYNKNIMEKLILSNLNVNIVIDIVISYLKNNSFYEEELILLVRKSTFQYKYIKAIFKLLKSKNLSLKKRLNIMNGFDDLYENLYENNTDIDYAYTDEDINFFLKTIKTVKRWEDMNDTLYITFNFQLTGIEKNKYEKTSLLLIELLKDEIYKFLHIQIGSLFLYYLSEKDSFLKNILSYLEDGDITKEFGLYIIPHLIEKRSDNDKLLVTILNFLKRKDVEFIGLDCQICESLKKIKRIDNEYIDILFDSINSYKVEDYYDIDTIETIVEILLHISIENFYAFEKLYFYNAGDKYCSYIYHDILKNIKISTLFKAYDKKFEKRNHKSVGCRIPNIFEYITDYTLKKFQPIYIKNNKLHTIENGKEISTQREVDEATLNKIKMLLKGDDLND